MFIPKTPANFDYDLWKTDENGVTRYWARVKATGEVSEVSHEIMKYLRSLEKRCRREFDNPDEGSVLSLDAHHEHEDEERGSWYSDNGKSNEEMLMSLREREFVQTLTDLQRQVYYACMISGFPQTVIASKLGIAPQSLTNIIERIRSKAKKIFWGG